MRRADHRISRDGAWPPQCWCSSLSLVALRLRATSKPAGAGSGGSTVDATFTYGASTR